MVGTGSLLPVGGGEEWECERVGEEDDDEADVGLEGGEEKDEGEEAHEEVEESVRGVELTADNTGFRDGSGVDSVVWSESGAEGEEETSVGEIDGGGEDVATEEVEQSTQEQQETTAVEMGTTKRGNVVSKDY